VPAGRAIPGMLAETSSKTALPTNLLSPHRFLGHFFMSTELHHTEADPSRSALPVGSPGSEGNITGLWIARLEDQTRRFPRESLQISFLLGALLQVFTGRGLLPKLVGLMFWLGRPVFFGFAAWRLYQLVAGRCSSDKTGVAANES
jgi:hypothetical protein